MVRRAGDGGQARQEGRWQLGARGEAAWERGGRARGLQGDGVAGRRVFLVRDSMNGRRFVQFGAIRSARRCTKSQSSRRAAG